MGAGDDSFAWNPGDDHDALEGQAGFDTMRFNGANVAENIDVSANGGRVRFLRDIASVTTTSRSVARATTRCSAARATTFSSAAAASTRSTAGPGATSSSRASSPTP